MNDITELIRALAVLAWPVVVLVAVLVLRVDLRKLLQRMNTLNLKGPGIEVSLSAQLDELQAHAQLATVEVNALPAAKTEEQQVSDENLVQGILDIGSQSPKMSLIALSADMEREVRRLIYSLGLSKEWRRVGTLTAGIHALERNGVLPPNVASGLELFTRVRNRLVHGRDVGNDDISAAIDSGILILRALRAIPREVYVVRATELPIFSDSHGRVKREDVSGIQIEVVSPGGAKREMRVFPITASSWSVGDEVTLEFNHDAEWGNSWYRLADANEIHHAWSSAFEFVGRCLKDVVSGG